MRVVNQSGISLFQLLQSSGNDRDMRKSFFIGKRRNMRDEYVHGSMMDISTYSRNAISGYTKLKCPDSSIDIINFDTQRIFKQRGETEYSIFVENREYLKKDLSKVDYSRCNVIKAENNRIVLDNNHYYGYQDKNGNKHVFSCVNNRLEQPYSDLISGRQNDASYQICKFWNMLSRDGTYMSLYYSQDEQRQMLNDAGIKEGFFSVRIGNNKQDYYYSNGNAGVVAVRRFEYDATYDMFAKRGSAIFNKYPIGSIFTVAGKEYALREDRTLDIPYGEDIFDVQFPKMMVDGE